MSIFARLGRYAAHPDPRAAACNMIALVVTGNQPLYPLYIAWLVGAGAGVACWTFLSTPFFAAVPFVARRHPVAGRMLLPLAGIANAVLAAKAFGVASGVGWFLIPCAMIAVLAFRPREWRPMLALLGLMLLALPLLLWDIGTPFGPLTPDQYRALARLDIGSVAALSIFVAARLGVAAWRDR
jgi:hypothetical protein